jgi:hypothetical protein
MKVMGITPNFYYQLIKINFMDSIGKRARTVNGRKLRTKLLFPHMVRCF